MCVSGGIERLSVKSSRYSASVSQVGNPEVFRMQMPDHRPETRDELEFTTHTGVSAHRIHTRSLNVRRRTETIRC